MLGVLIKAVELSLFYQANHFC